MRQEKVTTWALVTLVAACLLVVGQLELSAATQPVEREWIWRPLMTGGFAEVGVYQVGAMSLVEFDHHLVATTLSFNSSGLHPGIWRRADDQTWQRVDGGAFANAIMVGPLVEHNGYLYAAVESRRPYRSGDGVTWTQLSGTAIFDAGLSGHVSAMATVGDMLLIGVQQNDGAAVGASLDGTTWSKLATAGFGDSGNAYVSDFAGGAGVLYVGTGNTATGGEIWTSTDAGATWQQVSPDGFGSVDNDRVSDLHVRPSGELYAAVRNYDGASLWRRADATADWELVTGDAFGTHGSEMIGLTELDGSLWVTVATGASVGAQVWRLPPGGAWQAVAVGGISDPTNEAITSVLPLGDSLVFGTFNMDSGCELWQMLPAESTR